MTPQEYIDSVKLTLDQLDPQAIEAMVEAFYTTYERGGNIYTMGNGGSGASASHAAGDFLKGASYGLEKLQACRMMRSKRWFRMQRRMLKRIKSSTS